MERFGLARLDLMLMSWGEVVMLLDASYDGPSGKEEVREATESDYMQWI